MTFRKSRALVVGVGGLGAPLAIGLADAGVGAIGLIDDDLVEASNLHRQILFREADVGTSKLVAAKRSLGVRAPTVSVETHATRLLPSNAVDIVSRYDIVLEGSDNFPSKFLAADACAIAGKPIVHASAVRLYGHALLVSPFGRPCYRCVFEDVPFEHAPNCAEAGVLGPLVGLVAALQLDLALSALAGAPSYGEIVTVDASALFVRDASPGPLLGATESRRLAVRRRLAFAQPRCPLCGPKRRIHAIDSARYAPPEAMISPELPERPIEGDHRC